MFGLGTTELLLILLIVILLFGAGKLPQLGAGLAKGIKNFRRTMHEDESSGAGSGPKTDKPDSD
ncbi:MAG: twin-arginine translocase TatA/TatE family subunit [Deltaproteobacteria bacterium]|nr:MAG: twin-arginine translocase TatA/TatE family subunit [Deltaproteobacteria bacterium]